MPFKKYSTPLLRPLALGFLTLAITGQGSPTVTVTPPDAVSGKVGSAITVKVEAELNSGFHLNSHTPAEAYLIPLTLKWTPGPLETVDVQYPSPTMIKPAFSKEALSVLTGKFAITTKFKVGTNAKPGPATMMGKLRYQACNDQACFPPKTLDVKVPVEVK